MKKVFILGAGFVTAPMVEYLLKNNFKVTVGDIDLDKAKNLLKDNPNGVAVKLDVNDKTTLSEAIAKQDLVVSLLPWIFHLKVAEVCLANNKHLVTTSYVKPEMAAMDKAVRAKDLIFLNECGLDPGLDHMSAKKIIDEVVKDGGKIVEFESNCGGLPSPQHNDNPFGYKFSWSPRGVVLAAKNSARFLRKKEIVEISSERLFQSFSTEEIPGFGNFEVYPNRDSLPYIDTYSLNEVISFKRGTYRYPGWCFALKKFTELGLLEEKKLNISGKFTYKDFIFDLLGSKSNKEIKTAVAEFFEFELNNELLFKMEWLGLFEEKLVPENLNSPLDILCNLLERKLVYKSHEQDMIILKHEFLVEKINLIKEKISSTLIAFGLPGGHSAMARTVSLPAAIAVKLILQNKISQRGVLIPTSSEIYSPILNEMEGFGIEFKDKKTLV